MRNNETRNPIKLILFALAAVEIVCSLYVGYSIAKSILFKDPTTTLVAEEIFKFAAFSVLGLLSGAGILMRNSMLAMLNYYLVAVAGCFRLDLFLSFYGSQKIGFSQEELRQIYQQEVIGMAFIAVVLLLVCLLLFHKYTAQYIGISRKYAALNLLLAVVLVGGYYLL